MGMGHTDLGGWNHAPPDVAVDGPDESYHHSNLHIPAGSQIRLLTLCCKAAGNIFKYRLRLDPDKAVH